MPGHALALTSAADTTTAGTLPSSGVLLHRPQRYYDPLGLPLRSGRLRTRLIRRTWSRQGLRRRVSPVPWRTFHTCHRPYPGETRRTLRNGSVEHGLRRDMTGSALPLWICRGCSVHFSLRPAWWLPPKRLLTPRSGLEALAPSLGSATRRSGAYRDGTPTRWLVTAW